MNISLKCGSFCTSISPTFTFTGAPALCSGNCKREENIGGTSSPMSSTCKKQWAFRSKDLLFIAEYKARNL